jgi:hypothetical protein
MFKILIFNPQLSNESKVISCKTIPRIGDKIPLFYEPFPTVETIVLNIEPTTNLIDKNIKQAFGSAFSSIDAIITVI